MSTRKIIYADIDGVFNNNNYFKSDEYFLKCREKWNPKNIRDKRLAKKINTFYEFTDQTNIKWFNKIIQETDAKIVISSSWRTHYYKVLCEYWNLNGIEGQIIDKTDEFRVERWMPLLSKRGLEIEKHLSIYKPDSYVILDDDPDGDCYFLINQKVVRTNEDIGLTEDNANEAIKILNRGI
jgi:hypothetical protein